MEKNILIGTNIRWNNNVDNVDNDNDVVAGWMAIDIDFASKKVGKNNGEACLLNCDILKHFIKEIWKSGKRKYDFTKLLFAYCIILILIPKYMKQ